jgi:hypothetical protein
VLHQAAVPDDQADLDRCGFSSGNLVCCEQQEQGSGSVAWIGRHANADSQDGPVIGY